MANRLRLTDGTTTINFAASIEGFSAPKIIKEERHRALNGGEFVYQYYNKGRWEVQLRNVSTVNATQFNTWRLANTNLTFCPDTVDSPGTTHNVRITNKSVPLPDMSPPEWDEHYDGELILEER